MTLMALELKNKLNPKYPQCLLAIVIPPEKCL